MIEETLALATEAIGTLLPRETVLIHEPPSARGTLNETTGVVTFPAGDLLWEGLGRRTVRPGDRQAAEGGGVTSVDECTVTVAELPVGLRPGQIVSFPDSDEVEEWEIVRAGDATMGLGRKFVCERRTDPWTVAGS